MAILTPVRQPLSESLEKIKALAIKAIQSDGQVFLSENAVKSIAEQALSKGDGSHIEREALEAIFFLIRTADTDGQSASELDVLDLCEKGLGGI